MQARKEPWNDPGISVPCPKIHSPNTMLPLADPPAAVGNSEGFADDDYPPMIPSPQKTVVPTVNKSPRAALAGYRINKRIQQQQQRQEISGRHSDNARSGKLIRSNHNWFIILFPSLMTHL